MDYLIQARRIYLVAVNENAEICHISYLEVSAGHIKDIKVNEKYK